MHRIPLLAILLGVLLTAPAAAQSIEIRLRDDSTRAPIAGAIVRLLNENRAVAQGLTDAVGRVVLRAPNAGAYRLKVDRIGFAGMTTGALDLAAGETLRREVLMASRRMSLPELVVRGKTRCDPNQSNGPLAAALWDEIHKALTANVITQGQGAVPLFVKQFRREVSRPGKVLREWTFSSGLTRGQPFRSVDPATLAKAGFVREVDDSAEYSAPDAALLLSDQFVATHCFRAVPGKESLVGLAFEPAPGRRLPDVAGTLWVDRASSELQFLEYGYTRLSGVLESAELGGRVEFRRLPAGAWIVSYWYIRMPDVEAKGRRILDNTQQDARLVGYRDTGGRAVIATDSMGLVDRAVLQGRVYDSTLARGLPDAVVRVNGVPDSVLTDAQGRFELAVQASGDQTVTVRHSKLGLLKEATSREVLLSLGDTTQAQFAVAPLSAFVRARCGTPGSRSGLVGMTYDESGSPVNGKDVRLVLQTATGGTKTWPDKSAQGGLYALCDLPADRTLPVRTVNGRFTEFEQLVRLAPREWRWVDLRPSAGRRVAAVPATAPVIGERVLTGTVRQDSTGQPLAGVEVLIEGTNRRVVTDYAGHYSINQLPRGYRIALFRSVGFRPVRLAVRLVEEDTAWVNPIMVPVSAAGTDAQELAPLVVTAAPADRGIRAEFEERRRRGFGKFLDSTLLRRNEHMPLGDLIARASIGVGFSNGGVPESRRKIVIMNPGAKCYMAVYLDGIWLGGGDVGADARQTPSLHLFDVASLEAVEVYPGPAEVPAEFSGTHSGCGVIALWTRRH